MESFTEFFQKDSREKSKKRKKVPMEDHEKGDLKILDPETMTSTDLICAMMAQFIDNEEQLFHLADLLTEVENLKLVKEMRKLLNTPADTIKIVESYKGIGSDDLHEYSALYESKLKSNLARAQQNMLWKAGGNTKILGKTEDEIAFNVDSMLGAVDLIKLKSSAADYKENMLTNALESILSCLKARDTTKLVTFSDKLQYVKKMLIQFEKGQVPSGIDPSKYRPPSEAGLMQSHTLSTKAWIEKEVTEFLRDQYGSVGVAYCDAQDSDIRRFEQESNILLVSDDSSSPYHWSRSPSFTHSEGVEWTWRNEVAKANVILKSEIAQQEKEQKTLTDILALLADQYTSVREVKHNDAIAQVTTIENDVHHFICVYKRGKSKVDDILSNPNRIHVTSAELALTLNRQDYYTFTLSDGYTVLVIPTTTWKRSSTFKKNKNVTGHKGWAGCRRVQDNPFALWGALLSLGYTFKYFEFLRGNAECPDPGEYWTNIISKTESGAYNRLLGIEYIKSYNSRIIEMYAPGLFTGGLSVHPEVSKTGKMLLAESNKYADYTAEGTFTVDMLLADLQSDHTYTDSQIGQLFGDSDSVEDTYSNVVEGTMDAFDYESYSEESSGDSEGTQGS